MFAEQDRVFSWIEVKTYGADSQLCGPFYTAWVDAVGGSSYYNTLEEILKIPHLSETIKKRLSSAKEGTKIKMHRFHSNGSVYLERLSREQIREINNKMFLTKCLSDVEQAIKEATQSLQEQKDSLIKQLKSNTWKI